MLTVVYPRTADIRGLIDTSLQTATSAIEELNTMAGYSNRSTLPDKMADNDGASNNTIVSCLPTILLYFISCVGLVAGIWLIVYVLYIKSKETNNKRPSSEGVNG